MNEARLFLRSWLVLAVLATIFFGGEYAWEWNRAGRPGLDAMSWAGVNNAKLCDILSPMARAYNNILGMLLATIGLAIPLTANMHTPKLIDMFLRDRVNQFVLVFCMLGACNVLWVIYIIGPHFAPIWCYRIAVFGALAGWTLLIPYFFYVVRFLDPSNILSRLQAQVLARLREGFNPRGSVTVVRSRVRERAYQIETIIMKSVERGDRGVVVEGAHSLQRILEVYSDWKNRLPADWFQVGPEDCIGISSEAVELLKEERIWFEHRVVTLLFVAYQAVLIKMPDMISSFTNIVREIALSAARRHDEAVLGLTIRFFNNFLRETIKRKEIHALYDVLYQYRTLAGELTDYPKWQERIGGYFRYYGDQAVRAGLDFVPMFLAYDLGWMVREAFQRGSPAADALLQMMLAFDHRRHDDPRRLVVKAKVLLGAALLADGFADQARRVVENLSDLSPEAVAEIEQDLLVRAERSFWEVTDRQVTFGWVPPEQRESVQRFFEALKGTRAEPDRIAPIAGA